MKIRRNRGRGSDEGGEKEKQRERRIEGSNDFNDNAEENLIE